MSAPAAVARLTRDLTDGLGGAPGEDLLTRLDHVPADHSPLFAPDPSVLLPGIRTLVSAALARWAG
ncbi:hypothetical protein [Streptomyces galbus]|uniref:Uncharacterized protein n=1 Tax=Streptomyces galbus TaxID=33898 RepID=A0A4U5X2P5_STRGB|nr:hypothetical protein [Streptomyces galbus]TKT08702.1 hypothetical protein E4U92_13755 [Streptomyces galbus]GHD24310.1 hypothetical protein GCM10010335_07910 [Streptomyces galbus]